MAIGSSQALENFDVNGVGRSRFKGWFYCNGANGTPDLRGRFLVGRDTSYSDYEKLGSIGGLSFVKLSINELPSHTHIDSGHFHNISLKTDTEPGHEHLYNLMFKQKFGSCTDRRFDRFQQSFNPAEPTRFCEQLDKTDKQGEHFHLVNGYSSKNSVSLQDTGGDQSHENRPPYYVVQYIIYLG